MPAALGWPCLRRVADGTICHEGAPCHVSRHTAPNPPARRAALAERRSMIDEMPAGPPGEGSPARRAAEPDTGGWQPAQIAAVTVVCLAGLMVSLTMSVLIPVLPQVAMDLHSSTTSTEWLLTSTLLAAGVAVPIVGRLGDLCGKRLMLMLCAGFLAVGSLICGLSRSLIPLI